MINTPWHLVVAPGKKGQMKLLFDSELKHDAEAYAREHGGYVISTKRLVDEFADRPTPDAPEFTGPVHQHVGRVPPMPMPPTAPREPFPVIELHQFSEEPEVEIIDEREEPTRLELSPRLFADLLQALEQETIDPDEV